MGFLDKRRYMEPTVFKKRRFHLMHIYLSAGYPKLIVGDPYRITVMMRAAYGDKSYMAIRTLRPWKPTEVTRYEAQSSWSSTLE